MNEQEVNILKQDIVTKDKIISTKSQENLKNVEKVKSLESELNDCTLIDSTNQKTIINLNDKISNQKRKIKAWKIVSAILLIGLALK